MPSIAHEVLVDLLERRPSLAAELLTEALGLALPRYTEACVSSADLTRIQPAEYRADLVVVLLDDEAPAQVLVIEVQLGMDPRKRFTWPEYITGARAKYRCPVSLLVVAPDPDVAAWCAEPIETGVPGFVLRPSVLGREAVPVVTNPDEAARRPELGVLSAMAHGEGEQAAAIAAAVLPVVRGRNDERARLYGDLVLGSLNEAARRALEEMMKGSMFSDEGIAERFMSIGHDKGMAAGERAMLLRLLRGRFGELPATAVARLEGADVGLLERWGDRVLSAKTLAEVLDEPS